GIKPREVFGEGLRQLVIVVGARLRGPRRTPCRWWRESRTARTTRVDRAVPDLDITLVVLLCHPCILSACRGGPRRTGRESPAPVGDSATTSCAHDEHGARAAATRAARRLSGTTLGSPHAATRSVPETAARSARAGLPARMPRR